MELALANLSTASTLGRISLNEVSIPAGLVKASAEKDDFAVITLGRSNGEGLDRHAFDDFSLKTVELNMINQVSNAFHAVGKYQVQFASNATDIRETAEYRLRREECWKVERLFENK